MHDYNLCCGYSYRYTAIDVWIPASSLRWTIGSRCIMSGAKREPKLYLDSICWAVSVEAWPTLARLSQASRSFSFS